MARSIWRTHVAELRKRLPRGASGRQIDCIIWVIPGTGEGGLSRIGGIHYTACAGHTHPLDGQSIDFGGYGIPRAEVPSPWRELLDDPDEPFTFDLDRPGQESAPRNMTSEPFYPTFFGTMGIIDERTEQPSLLEASLKVNGE